MPVDWSTDEAPLDLLREVAFYEERADYYAEKLWEARARIIALEDYVAALNVA